MTATLTRDRVTGCAWLEFPTEPDAATKAKLKLNGWRFSRHRDAWYNHRRYVMPPQGIEFDDGGECHYSAERADRFRDRAQAAAGRSGAAQGRATQIASFIPPGQPI